MCDTTIPDIDESFTEEETETEKERRKSGGHEDDADSFLDSLGLSKNEHFPRMEEQRKLTIKSELNRLDNRPESTIEISDVQGFFNFFTNSSLICATSGRMIGVPPTLISPTVFEGASCHTNKHNYGKIKQRTKAGETHLHCLDIYGLILPTQLKGVVQLQLASSTTDEFSVRTKGYENLFSFNTLTTNDDAGDDAVLSGEEDFLRQKCHAIPDQNDLRYEDGVFKF